MLASIVDPINAVSETPEKTIHEHDLGSEDEDDLDYDHQVLELI